MLILQDTPVGDLTRGGQIVIHFLRMLAQVIRKFGGALALAVLAGTAIVFLLMTSSYERYLGWRFVSTYLATDVLRNPDQLTEVQRADGTLVQVRMGALRQSATLQEVAQQLLKEGEESLLIACAMVGGLFGVLVGWVWRSGTRQRTDEILRGTRIVTSQELTHALRAKKRASDLCVADVPLVAGSETLHTLVTGASGTGKSETLYQLMRQARRRRERFICFSPSGDFLAQFLRAGYDHVLNPFDARCPAWDLWAECPDLYHFDKMAAALIPDKSSSGDPFWNDAARAVISCLAQETGRRNERSMARFLSLLQGPLPELFEYLKHTEAGSQLDPESEKPALSIRTTAVTYARALKYLPAEGTPFNIRQWVRDEGGEECVFLTASDEQCEAVRPLLTTWLELFTSAILSLRPNRSRRIWLFIDELPALNRIPSLARFQSQGRKYGGCGVFAFQQLSQLRTTYGRDGADSVVGGCGTWLCFRENDPTSAEWIAKAFGQVEIKEAQQGLSYGANDMRDGISLTQVTKLRSNIIPIEVSQLNDLEGYIRLPGRWPFASVKLDWHTPIERAPAYIPATTPRVWSPRPSAATATPPAPSLPAPTVSGDLFSAGERPAEPRPQHAAARTA